MSIRAFTSTPSTEQQEEREFEFTLDGESFNVTLRSDADSVLEWSELAAAATESEDLDSPAGAAFTSKFFKLTMLPAEYSRFRRHMRLHKTSPEILVNIMASIQDEMQAMTEETAERPTGPLSRSSNGPAATDARTLEIISLAGDGDISFADAPAPVAPARPAGKKPAKRKAG